MKTANPKVVELKKLLPGYNISASKNGLSIYVSRRVADINDWTEANAAVRKAVKRFHLDEVGAGTGLGYRDWHFADLDVEKQMTADAKQIHDSMKTFFKKWGNAYCDVVAAYGVIEKMRDMLETDEA